MAENPNFELLCSLKLEDITVSKYKSTSSGINIFFADVDGPLVRGYFSVATEAYDDDGLAHTLEHLVFHGSETYPWKGVLDLVANRCLASGTEALTNADHTLFKMTTAGADGFLSLIPVYLDHILYPALTDAAYLTEVHHVTEKGEDGGIIYAEMQARENTEMELAHYELMRAMYPGKCGYKSNLGGLLKNLRENTNNERVKNFHKQFYRPENLTIIIIGQMKHSDLFEALQPLQEKIMAKGDRGPFTRPWQDPVPPLIESVDLEVYFPSDDEDNGLIYAGWRGPAAKEIYDFLACELLLEYLTSGSPNSIEGAFVEIDDPYASLVGSFTSEHSETALVIALRGVPVEKIPLINDHLIKVLKKNYESGINTEKMKDIVNRVFLKVNMYLESSLADAISKLLILDALYGDSKEDFKERLNQLEDLLKLAEEPESYWLKLLQRYIIDAPMVFVKGIPSCEKQKELMELEKKRIAERIAKLGKEGLEQKGRDLEEAVTLNARVPAEIWKSIPIPDITGINFHHVKSYTTDTSEQHPLFDVTKLPLYTYLDDYKTSFIHMTIIMDTSSIDRHTRLYLPLLMEALIQSPVERNGAVVPYEDIVNELQEDTITYSADTWHCHSACLRLELELSKYEKGVQWIKELLYDSKISVDRLKIIGTKMINDVSISKRDGSKITSELIQSLRYNKESDHFTSSFLRQRNFLTKLMERLNSEDGQNEVLHEMEAARAIITANKNIVLSIGVNIDKLAREIIDLYNPWKILETHEEKNKNGFHVTHDWELLNQREDIPTQGCVLGLGCVESAYLCAATNGIQGYEHSDFPALFLCTQYLTQTEGPLWKSIHGQGLAYKAIIKTDPEGGIIYFELSKATNIIAAYKEVKSIVESHFNEDKWNSSFLESAKSSLIFGIIDNEGTVGDLINHAFAANFRGVSDDYNYQLIQRIKAVSIDDLKNVATKYLMDIFDPEKCTTTVVCHPLKVDDIVENFKLLNHDLRVFSTLEESYLNDW